MKSTFNKGETVVTNRKYKKRYNAAISGTVQGSTYYGRFVLVKSADGTEHSIKPEFLMYS